MNFLNPEEQKRVAIRKAADVAPPPAAAPAPAAPGAKGAAAPAKPAAKPGATAPAKPGAPAGAAPTVVNAVVKPKPAPQVQVLQVEDGVFEVHFTCSCGEQYVIRCDSVAKPGEAPKAS
ncbi:MAG: hypothetical protein PW734_09975 [Verrucomicrobium sp.]|nr:hypothetical protein [Verrucomicrobium sp.]